MLVALLMAFLIPFSKMVSRRVQECLDSELYRQGLSLRTRFTDELFYLREEAQLLAEMENISALVANHNESRLRHLMALYQSTHDSDGIYLITNTSEIYTSSLAPPLDKDTVAKLAVVQMGFNGQSFGEMVTVDGHIWMVSGAPHLTPEGTIDAVFLILREVDADFLESLIGGLIELVVLTDGQVMVQSRAGETPKALLNSFAQVLDSQSNVVMRPFTFRSEGSPFRALILPLATPHSHTYAVALVKNARIIHETRWATLRWGSLFGLIGIIVTLMVVQFHVVEIFRPLQGLVASTKRIAEGDLDAPLEPSGAADVYELATHFERMRQQLKNLLEKERSLSENLEEKVLEKSEALEEMCRAREQLMARLISSQEEERRRVSRELHDETSQELANLIIRLGTLARITQDESILPQLEELRIEAARTLEGVNRIVMDLRPGLLDEYGLAPAIQWYANARLESQGIPVNITISGTPREFTPHVQASIYRMIQEAINNISQHAQATQVDIRMDWLDDAMKIVVQDNGQGFDPNLFEQPTEGHFGLLGIQERVVLLNGSFDIESAPGQGTKIIIEIPYHLNTTKDHDQH